MSSGCLVHVAGTLAHSPSGEVLGLGDMRVQAETIAHNLRRSLEAASATTRDVTQVRAYTTDLRAYQRQAAPILADALAGARGMQEPLVVQRLALPQYLLEVDLTAAVAGAAAVTWRRFNPEGLHQPRHYSQVVVSPAGTLRLLRGEPERVGDMTVRDQVEAAMEDLAQQIENLHAGAADVARIRVFTTDVDRFMPAASDVVVGFFSAPKPASTLLQVEEIGRPGRLVAVEASVILADAA